MRNEKRAFGVEVYNKLRVKLQQRQRYDDIRVVGDWENNGIFRIYKKLLQANKKKMINPVKKYTKNLNRHENEGEMQLGDKYMKTMLQEQLDIHM